MRVIYLFVLREREVPLLHVAHRQVHVDDDLIGDARAVGLRLEVADVLAVDIHGDAAARLELYYIRSQLVIREHMTTLT